MGKKNKEKSLGRALIKERFGTHGRKQNSEGYLHTVDLKDGYDWGHLNLQSVTEESSFQEFLSTAELVGTEFQGEKLNVKFVSSKSQVGILSKEKLQQILKLQEENKQFIKIPRRPKWNKSTTPQELEQKERDVFLEWKKNLALLQETKELILTPYEKNLEFWKQLWRVVERSDVVIQIVDGRNPLLFRCEDLELYVKELDPNKENLILINKADFLTEKQRQVWADYFSSINVKVIFFSATLAALENTEETNEDSHEDGETKKSKIESDEDEDSSEESEAGDTKKKEDQNYDEKKHSDDEKETSAKLDDLKIDEAASSETEKQNDDGKVLNSSKLFSREDLISFFKSISLPKTFMDGILTIGLVGYPNVGKSSTINALLMDKKVSVSATPGKTKHFQTLYLDKDLLLCDCPGLVMPSFVSTKAEMILNGILPINQMKDHVPPVNLLATLIPRHCIETLYGIMIPLPPEGEDPDRPPHSEEILNAYGYNRGFMTQNGQPDNPRSARCLLIDFVNGKLLHCVAPPGHDQSEFHVFTVSKKKPNRTQQQTETTKPQQRPTTSDLDKAFFQPQSIGVHAKVNRLHRAMNAAKEGSISSEGGIEKPWRVMNKLNKKRKEKSRRLYSHLDKH